MATKRPKIMVLLILSLFYLSSCDEMFSDKIEGNNVVVTKERPVATFDEVVSAGNFDVYVTIADSTTLHVEAEENLLPFITTKVSGQKFYVEPKNNYYLENNKPMKIILTTPNMEGVKLTGSGIIVCDSLTADFLSIEITGSGKIMYSNIDVKDLDCEISGSGNIFISGFSARGELDITGSGSIRSLDLVQGDCDAQITGSGSMYVNVGDYLKAVITGSGNVYYTGYPTIEKHITGTGKVKRY